MPGSAHPGSFHKPPPTERDGDGVSCSVSVLTGAEKPRIQQQAAAGSCTDLAATKPSTVYGETWHDR